MAFYPTYGMSLKVSQSYRAGYRDCLGTSCRCIRFLLGFLTWPPKKLRSQVFILSDDKGRSSIPQFSNPQWTSSRRPTRTGSTSR